MRHDRRDRQKHISRIFSRRLEPEGRPNLSVFCYPLPKRQATKGKRLRPDVSFRTSSRAVSAPCAVSHRQLTGIAFDCSIVSASCSRSGGQTIFSKGHCNEQGRRLSCRGAPQIALARGYAYDKRRVACVGCDGYCTCHSLVGRGEAHNSKPIWHLSFDIVFTWIWSLTTRTRRPRS
jgi:hypothetical protein